jgi:Lrp/AsnC family transcriptional regulator for asnA, asnC and gidA
MELKYEIDDLDRKILRHLLEDGRKPFLEIARDLMVSGGTIHQRVEKMQQAGILKGYTVIIDREKLGFGVTVLIGIHLKNAKDYSHVVEGLKGFPEVLEVHYTTGNYALIAKVSTASIQDYHIFLTESLQALKEIQSTESFICLASPIQKEIRP